MDILQQLNSELTNIFNSSKFFESDGWHLLQSIISKAKEDMYQIQVSAHARLSDFSKKEQNYLYRRYSKISEIIIYKAELIVSTQAYNVLDAESLQELIEEGIADLNNNDEQPSIPINFFKLNGNVIELKNLHHFHIHDTVERAVFQYLI